jgi:hypothetical protein
MAHTQYACRRRKTETLRITKSLGPTRIRAMKPREVVGALKKAHFRVRANEKGPHSIATPAS